ncbi:hypothetical protein NKH85_17115 [Mesorhizobium sp. M0924]|uniref:hypothetical protein n=1 Tax=unclassified Mesorhizobium TaxID=325217 RepID=UPI003337C692
MVKTTLVAALLALTACGHMAGGSFCDIEKPNRNPVEDMTVPEARDALAHNLKGERLCGWKP